MERRGISPIIATILLIIMTVGIAALMYTWMSGMFTQLTTQAEQQVGRIGEVDFELIYVTHNTNNYHFEVTLVNTGRVNLNFSRPRVFVRVDYYQKPYETVNSSICNIVNSDALTNVAPGNIVTLELDCGFSSDNPININLYRYIITVNYLGIIKSITYG
ncbi:MAG: archaellin/type IV pilin N-terminal domain-containing protein [Nanoarchaeales archaeon]